MSNEVAPPKKLFFKMPENFAELTDEEIDELAYHLVVSMIPMQPPAIPHQI